jgi:hypothetical protein
VWLAQAFGRIRTTKHGAPGLIMGLVTGFIFRCTDVVRYLIMAWYGIAVIGGVEIGRGKCGGGAEASGTERVTQVDTRRVK